LQKKLVVARDEPVELFDDIALLHLNFVFTENTQLFKEIEHYEQEVRVVTIEHRNELGNNSPVLHLAFDLKIFCQVQQQVECDKEDFFLLLYHNCELFFFSVHEFCHLLVPICSLGLLKIFRFSFEFSNAHYVALDFVVNNSHRCVSYLVN